MKSTFDCVVVGAGIAGMTAAIYLKRANLNVVIVNNSAPGGLLNKITTIENFPGYLQISGPELAYKVYEQVNQLGIEIRYGNTLKIENHIVTTDIEEISTKFVLIATGRNAKRLDNTANLKNVSYCALCDGNLYKGENIALIGNGNSALEEAIYLSDLCSHITMLVRSSSLKGENILIEKVKQLSNVDIFYDCVIETLNNENNVLASIKTNHGLFDTKALFISIGYEPSNNFLKDIVTDKGYILVDNHMKTNLDYIYACGDIIKKDVYQLTTAVGEATTAAINIKKELNKQ